jgi:D-alanine transaminase
VGGDQVIVYFNGQLMPKDDVRISPDDRGFLLADGVYEVIASYRGRLFEADAHFKRLERSLREVYIEGVSMEKLRDAAEMLVQANCPASEKAALYVQITRGVASRSHAFPPCDTPPTVYISASPVRSPQEEWERGVEAILIPDTRWARCDIKSVALLPNVLASQRAKESGAAEAIFVRDGAITEGSHTNVCVVFDGRMITYPRSNYILAGITRGIVLDLCGELGVPYDKAPILKNRFIEVDEAMLTGTITEIVPVVRVDGRQVGDGKPGPITRKLQQAFREMTG